MTKLSLEQQTLLTLAASDTTLASDDNKSTAASLIKRGLLISVPRADGPSQLLITDKGRAAIGAPADVVIKPASEAPKKESSPRVPKASGKIPALLVLLRRPEGAGLAEMMEATGWQAHSVRGAISGAIAKKLGLKVTSEKTAEGRIYRVADEVQS